MNVVWITCGFVLISVLIPQCTSQQSLKAEINMAGVKGEVVFTQDTPTADVTIRWNIRGSGTYNWQLTELYVNYDTADKCSTENIGARYGSAGGTVSAGTSTSTVSGISVSGLNTIEGRTLLLQKNEDNNIKACASILSTDKYETLISEFKKDIFGRILFRKAPNSDVTLVYTDLYFAKTGESTQNYKWKIYKGSGINCQSASTVFNPTNKDGTGCSSTVHSNCPIGELTQKLGNVNIGNIQGSIKTRFVDQNLPVTTNTIAGNTIVLMDTTGTVKACASISKVTAKSAMVYFSRQGVKGQLIFTQASPLDRTNIEVSLKGLNNKANGYHIHMYPVPQRSTTDQKVCGDEYVSGHFNPFKMKNFPQEGQGTNDQFEIGDISGKFGGLSGKDGVNMTYSDWNLPLFGPRSIIHRSLVIHRNSDGSRWICANIENVNPIKTAMARFTYPFVGHVILRQDQTDENSDTSIFIELNTADGSTASTSYDWAVHENKVGGDGLDTDVSKRCVSTGKLYSPDIQIGSDLNCSKVDSLSCKIGDLSQKHGRVTVRSSDNTSAEHFFTDSRIALTGPHSLVGKSVVLLDGSKKIACATVYKIRERIAKVDTWSTSVVGTMKFSQGNGVIENNAMINNELVNLNSVAGPYHVHEFPIPANAPNPCSPASVSGHLNPFGITVNPQPGLATHDQYEMGDLSGKFGLLSGTYDRSNFMDTNLDLFGLHSIVGRSVVIHKTADGSRWSCGNIKEDTTVTRGQLYQAKATFDSIFTGQIMLSQYLYPDGSMSDTSIEMSLKYSDGTEGTKNHNWHVHEYSIQGDDQSVTGRCSSAGGHYNPFRVNVSSGYDECGPTSPLRCELGDQSEKLGTYNVGDKIFTTDVYLPLNGPQSVIGRSIVFHVKEKGAGRLTCATIMPIQSLEPLTITLNTPRDMNRPAISGAIAESLSADPWEVMVLEKSATTVGCTDILVYFSGPDAQNIRKKALEMIKNTDNKFWKKYDVCSGCKRNLVSFMVMVFLISIKLIL